MALSAPGAGFGAPPTPEEAPAATTRFRIRDAVLGLLFTVVASNILAGFVFVALGETDLEGLSLAQVVAAQAPLWLCMGAVVVAASRRRGSGSLVADYGLRARWSDVPLGIAVGLGTQIGVSIVVGVAYRLLGIDTENVGESAQVLSEKAEGSVLGVVLLVLIVGVGAPLFEELFWRGLWLRALERLGSTIAIAISSALFALAHLSPYDFPALVIVGAVLGWLTVRTGRLGPALVAHLAFNLVAVTLTIAG